MPAPAYPVPPSPSVLQLYRHLLRECSYLPPAFRAIIAAKVQDRFHRHTNYDPRAQAHRARAIKSLRTLRAANSGDRTAMESLIANGFGRSGPRRRELMWQFVVSQGASDSAALESILGAAAESKASRKGQAASAQTSKKAKPAFFDKWDQPKLLQILQSQRQQQKDTKGTTSWPGSAVKNLDPDQFVPDASIWGRPPSEILTRAKRANWWRRSADKIMPPLGKGEWDMLEQLSQGAQDKGAWVIPQRRAHVKSVHDASNLSQWNWEYATKPAAIVERPKALKQQRRSGQKDNNPYGVSNRDRTLSGRWFRRAYNRTWQLTPTMIQDPNTLKYSFTWGRVQANIPPPTEEQLEVFNGVDQQGHKIKRGAS